MPGIIWLASYPKSGNTWLRAFLANFISGSAEPVPINDLPNFVLGDGFLIHYEQLTGKAADDLSEEELTRLRPRLHEWLAVSRPPNDVFVKTHNALVLADGVPLITPHATAGAIYVVRNPFDVAVSFAHHYQIPYQRAVDALCDKEYVLPPSGGQVTQVLCDWSGHYRSWTSVSGLTRHVMRYEDMKRSPQKAFRGLIKFLGLPQDKARLAKAIRFSSFDQLASQERRTDFVEARPDKATRFFRRGKVGGWREVLSAEQTDQLIETHREVMSELGYIDADGRLKV